MLIPKMVTTVSPSWSLFFFPFELGLALWLLWPIECSKNSVRVLPRPDIKQTWWFLLCILGNTSRHIRRTHHAVRKSKLCGGATWKEMTDWPLVVQSVSAEVPDLWVKNRSRKVQGQQIPHGTKMSHPHWALPKLWNHEQINDCCSKALNVGVVLKAAIGNQDKAKQEKVP